MAPKSKRQRHLKKLFDSQDRAADGRFRGEVQSCDFVAHPENIDDVTSEAGDNDIKIALV